MWRIIVIIILLQIFCFTGEASTFSEKINKSKNVRIELYKYPTHSVSRFKVKRVISIDGQKKLANVLSTKSIVVVDNKPNLSDYVSVARLKITNSNKEEIYRVSFTKDLKWVKFNVDGDGMSSSVVAEYYDPHIETVELLKVDDMLKVPFFKSNLFAIFSLILAVIIVIGLKKWQKARKSKGVSPII